MKPKTFPSRLLIAFLVATLLTVSARGQNAQSYQPTQHELYDTLAKLDSALFSIAYTCHLDKLSEYFTDDMEFYHDKGGPTYTKAKFLETAKNNFCGEHAIKLRREVVKGSLQVYPMDHYGAIQRGLHVFYVTENGKEQRSGMARFTHLWQYKDGKWRITRVLSYDHHE